MPAPLAALTGETYNRQNRIEGLTVPQTATVVGLGGTGFWTASFLAMSGVQELILIDDDTLETSNLNRLPFSPGSVGRKKVNVTLESIQQTRPNTRIEKHEVKITTPDGCRLLRGSVFCCTDNLKSQQMICAYCRKNNLPYQRIGYDGTLLNVSTGFPLSFEEATDEGGYTQTPSWVIPAATAAALGVYSALRETLCIMDEMGNLTIAGSTHIPGRLHAKLREKMRDNIRAEVEEDEEMGYCPDCERGYCGECEHDGYTHDDTVEDMISEARDSGDEAGYERGDDEGYSRGYEEGITEGRRQAENEQEE